MASLNADRVRRLLKAGELERLFVEELGWDRHRARQELTRSSGVYTFAALAEKRGVVAFACTAEDGQIPSYKERIELERELRKLVHEHVVVFVAPSSGLQIWQWVRRETGRPTAAREHHFHVSQAGDGLIAKLDQLLFTLADEDSVTLAEVTQRAAAAFDVERVTRRFYDQFQAEHHAFVDFIKGFTSTADTEWYASLMLNRLMFVYFMQKRGFISDDRDYLRNRLRMVQESRGRDRFHSFYRQFLIRLFHEGLGTPLNERDADLAGLLGDVPYLNGGLFEPHRLEGQHSIDIDDEAFERLFSFFDSYTWHLDDRPLRADNEINPDVLGYIFEKYINQKEMGAYYTKEDVTGYIARNTISSTVLARLGDAEAVASARRMMAESPERFLHPAMFAKKLPSESDASALVRAQRRARATKALRSADADWRIPMSMNADLSLCLEDVIQQSSPEELWQVWSTLNSLTVLDPTCGSGAFLFAALRVLQPLFEAVIGRMEAELGRDDLEPGVRRQFAAVIERQSEHANPSYFIVKCILLNNLYGVDLMEEAVEICKLRLFLHAASTLTSRREIEPLPDLDFNVRPGNTVLGFCSRSELEEVMGGSLDLEGDQERILAACDEIATLHSDFRRAQAQGESIRASKDALRESLSQLRSELDKHLLLRVGGVTAAAQSDWLTSNRPFHWFAEFHEIVERGGFDVIIGNPPYTEVPRNLSRAYLGQVYDTALERWSRDEDLYTFILERSLGLLAPHGSFGMVLPLSISFSTKRSYVMLRQHLAGHAGDWWFSHYDRIPSALFGNDVRTRCTIALHTRRAPSEPPWIGVTELLRWSWDQRDDLFQTLQYARIPSIEKEGIPKLGSQVQADAFAALTRGGTSLEADLSDSVSFTSLAAAAPNFPERSVYVGGTAYNWFPVWREIPETTDALGRPSLPARTACYRFRSDKDADLVFALLGSSLGYWWWAVASDGFNLKKWLMDRFPISTTSLSADARRDLSAAGASLRKELRKHYVYKDNRGRVGNWYMPACAAQGRAIDQVLAKHVPALNEKFFEDVRAFNARFSTAESSEEEGD